jgi:hypothetical protein
LTKSESNKFRNNNPLNKKRMKTTLSKVLKCFCLTVFILAGTQIYLSCSHKITVPKTLTFTEVEKEFHFAKPLSEYSKQRILKQFGSVQNYHDSIISRRNNPHYKSIVVIGNPAEADSATLSIFKMSAEELESKGIKVIVDPKIKNQQPVNSN